MDSRFLVEFVGTQTKKTGVGLPVAVAIIAIATTTKTKLDIVKAFILKFGTGEITWNSHSFKPRLSI